MQENLQDWLSRKGGTQGNFEPKVPFRSYCQWLRENPQGLLPE